MQAEGHDPDELLNHPEIIRRNHQLHVNVERIRVPEIYFEPYIAGLDQAGIPEVIQNILLRSFDGNFNIGGQLRSMIENVYITGGGSLLPILLIEYSEAMWGSFQVAHPSMWRGLQTQSWILEGMQNGSILRCVPCFNFTKEEYGRKWGPESLRSTISGTCVFRDLR